MGSCSRNGLTYGPHMDFLQKTSGPYMDVFIENMVCKAHNRFFERKTDQRFPNSELCRKVQKFKMAICTISLCLNIKHVFFVWGGKGEGGCINKGWG